MNDAIIVAIITASASLVVAALTFYLTKRHELFVQQRSEKLNHYKVLLSALSGLAMDGTDKVASDRFAMAVNTIALAAPQYVIDALFAFHKEVTLPKQNRTQGLGDKLLNELLLAIRRDIKLAKGDNATTFNFQFIGSIPNDGGQHNQPQ